MVQKSRQLLRVATASADSSQCTAMKMSRLKRAIAAAGTEKVDSKKCNWSCPHCRRSDSKRYRAAPRGIT